MLGKLKDAEFAIKGAMAEQVTLQKQAETDHEVSVWGRLGVMRGVVVATAVTVAAAAVTSVMFCRKYGCAHILFLTIYHNARHRQQPANIMTI